MKNWINGIQLAGNIVKLVPLEDIHKEQLLLAAYDGDLWNLWYTSVPSERTIDRYIDNALMKKKNGTEYPFVVIHQKSGEVIGSTRFYNIQQLHRRLEIGYTWYAQRFQRTGVNTEVKTLMLQYAFENLKCIAVQFMTDWYNLRSREAIARLGAKQDGVLRNHRLNSDGSYRDSVVFSITNQEWSGVKKSLELKMKQ